MRRARVMILALLVVLAAVLAAPSAAADPSRSPGVVPPSARIGGKTYAQWSAAWWQYALQAPVPTNSLVDPTGSKCRLGQSGPVFFLVGSMGSGAVNRTQCMVPRDRFLFFPLVNAFNANDPGGSATVAQLFAGLGNVTATALHATVDGKAVTNLDPAKTPFRVCAGPRAKGCGPAFGFTLPANNIFDAPAGRYEPAVADGYYLMLTPLSPGKHVIAFGGTSPATTQDIRYELTVR